MNYDTLVIGSGAGGATLATRLAERGEKVLMIERGLQPEGLEQPDEARMAAGEACFDVPLLVRGQETRPLLGSLLGGSTALYGAVLMRPSPCDLTPGRYYGRYLDRDVWDWPLRYEELEPYLEQAEDLFHVAGDACHPMPYVPSRRHAYPQAAMPLSLFNQGLYQRFHRHGTKAFPLPLAINQQSCQQCARCPGYLCPYEARASSWNRGARQLWQKGSLEILTGHSVERLLFQGRLAREVLVTSRSGQDRRIQAEKFVLAAGALGTPRVLLQSEVRDPSGLIGRHYMYHLGVACISVLKGQDFDPTRFQKQLGFTDFYLGTQDFPHKLGMAQSIPIPGPLAIRDRLPFPLPLRLLKSLHSHLHTFVLMIEDLPQASNRVLLTGRGLQLEHGFHPYDHFRAQGARRLLTRLFRQLGWTVSLGICAGFERKHLGHQVGTCRMGFKPESSVVDPQGRLHAYDNIFVADGSWLPTSLGVGPALTIAAQALRLADILKPTTHTLAERGRLHEQSS